MQLDYGCNKKNGFKRIANNMKEPTTKFKLILSNPLQNDDNASGIHFTAGSRRSHERMGSTASMGSLAATVTRVNTVSGALKKFFSRGGEDTRSMTGSGNLESGSKFVLFYSPKINF